MESSIFDAIGIDPGIIIIFVLGVLLIVLIYMIKISMKMSRFMKKYKMFMRGMDGASLERAFAARLIRWIFWRRTAGIIWKRSGRSKRYRILH